MAQHSIAHFFANIWGSFFSTVQPMNDSKRPPEVFEKKMSNSAKYYIHTYITITYGNTCRRAKFRLIFYWTILGAPIS